MVPKNSNTSTSFWWSARKTWREEKSITLEIEEYEQADMMNRSLEKSYAEVKNKNNLLFSGASSMPIFFYVDITKISNHVVSSSIKN